MKFKHNDSRNRSRRAVQDLKKKHVIRPSMKFKDNDKPPQTQQLALRAIGLNFSIKVYQDKIFASQPSMSISPS